MKKIVIYFLFIIFIFLKSKITKAQVKILINEFLIEPQPQQVEIINIGSESANLKDWIIDDDGGSSSVYKIENDTIIQPNSCLIFKENFYLNTKSADTIRLFDNNYNLVDSYSYKLSPGQNISFQRIPDGDVNWSTESATLGLFNLTKTSCLITTTITSTPIINPSQTPTPILTFSPTITPTQIPTIPQIIYENIFISEAMVNPLAGEKEWVELFNNNNFTVYLNNWYIDDIEGGGASPKAFSIEIPPKGYKAIILSTSIFNNSGDSVRLLDSNKNLKDSFEYQSTIENKTWGRISIENDNFCLQEPSFEKPNDGCIENNNNQKNTQINQQKNITALQPTQNQIKPNIKISPKTKNIQIYDLKNKQNYLNNFQAEVLGITTNIQNENEDNKKKLIYFFSINSVFYAFLTQIMILIKIKLKYDKFKKFILSFSHP